MTEVRIATRASDLAVAQATWVGDRLAAEHPGLRFRLVEVTTTGDRDRTTPVASLTEVGAFVRAVQQSVLDGDADLAVHSCKDLPVAGPEDLRSFFPAREAPWDVLCGATPDRLPAGARVGTGSPRRQAQLLAMRPDLVVDEIRGNVGTRLDKVASGEFDAVVLAEAGLRRIGLDDAIDHRFSLEEMVPAPAQAALAVETPADGPVQDLVAAIEDPVTGRAVRAERAVLERTGAGCRAALGVLAQAKGASMTMHGFVEDERGARRAVLSATDPDEAAGRLIDSLEL